MQNQEKLIIITPILYISWGFLLPLLLCLIFKYVFGGGIGPFVFLHLVLSFFVFPLIGIIFSVKFFKRSKAFMITSIILSIIAALPFAIVVINYFIWLTAAFGIMDYHLM